MKKKRKLYSQMKKIKYIVSKKFYICKKGFSTDDGNKIYDKVRDHFHCTGKYRGAAHSICSLR